MKVWLVIACIMCRGQLELKWQTERDFCVLNQNEIKLKLNEQIEYKMSVIAFGTQNQKEKRGKANREKRLLGLLPSLV